MKNNFWTITARWFGGAICAMTSAALLCGSVTRAEEKRTIYTEDNFHWQGKLVPGQTLEVIDTNGGIDASGSADDSSQVDGEKRGRGEEKNDAFVEVVEYSDGVTICAVYAKTAAPGRCHRGGVRSEDTGNFWHSSRAKITFSLKVARGVNVKAMTTNGDIHARNMSSVVDAATTNGSVEVSTSEWASGRSTNGHMEISMGKAGWKGELAVTTTNGGLNVALPASAAFDLHASTTNGSIRTDFPVTVEGTFGPKNVHGAVGGGGRELRLATTNGGIEIRKSGA